MGAKKTRGVRNVYSAAKWQPRHKCKKYFYSHSFYSHSFIRMAHFTLPQAIPSGFILSYLSVLLLQTRPLLSTRALWVSRIGFSHPPPLHRRLSSLHLYSHSMSYAKIFLPYLSYCKS